MAEQVLLDLCLRNLVFGVVLVYESNCLLEGPGVTGAIPSVEVLLRDPSSYLLEFWRIPLKTLND